MTLDYKNQLIQESDGHPYVIKILMGQVQNEQRAVKPSRIVANSDHILTALFERTYVSLTPAAQRVFLLLSSWRVYVPSIAVEAVSLRPGNERFDVAGAISELRRFSFIEEIKSEAEGETFIGVPLAAASYGQKKIEVSQFKVIVDEDRKLLMEFGAGKREDAHRGVLPRVQRLISTVATKASKNPKALNEFLPILEYLASRVPMVNLSMADLVLEMNYEKNGAEYAKKYLRQFLEISEDPNKSIVWFKLATLCKNSDDVTGEVHALGEMALLPTVTPEEMGTIANRINNRIRDLKGRKLDEAWSTAVRLHIERVAIAMERRVEDMSATDCSRLAWLYLNIGHNERARVIVEKGLDKDKNNTHCIKLAKKL